jgi:hypothetical protein
MPCRTSFSFMTQKHGTASRVHRVLKRQCRVQSGRGPARWCAGRPLRWMSGERSRRQR